MGSMSNIKQGTFDVSTGTFGEVPEGHLLLSYIASCAVKMIQMRLKVADLFTGARLQIMRNQKCTIYQNRIVTEDAQRR